MRRLVALALAASLLSGCVVVKPWQRGELANSTMSWEADPLAAALDNHVYFSKEAASGGTGLGGGGCGCN